MHRHSRASEVKRLDRRWPARLACGGVLLGAALLAVRARSVADLILDLAVRLPRDPLGLLGNALVLGSAMFLVVVKHREASRRRPDPGRHP